MGYGNNKNRRGHGAALAGVSRSRDALPRLPHSLFDASARRQLPLVDMVVGYESGRHVTSGGWRGRGRGGLVGLGSGRSGLGVRPTAHRYPIIASQGILRTPT